MTILDQEPDEKTSIAYEDDELSDRLMKWIQEAAPAISTWRQKEAEPAYGFVAGDQWDEEDKAALESEMRAPITYNRVGPMINAVAGAEISNRKKVRYSPREVNDTAQTETISQAADWARDRANAEDEESDAFRDCLICGLGWTETHMDYDSNSDGEIAIARINPLEMGWDIRAQKANLSDTRFRWREREMRKIDVEDMIGGDVPDSASTSTLDEPAPITRVNSQDDYGSAGNASASETSGDGLITVRQIQWWDREDRIELLDPEGKKKLITTEEYQQIVESLQGVGMLPPQGKKVEKTKIFRQVMMVGRTFLAPPIELPCGFTFCSVTGQRDQGSGMWYGLVRAMIDPQRWANKFLSQILHIVNSNAKGGILAESDAFADPKTAQADWAKPDSIVWMNPGAIQKGKVLPKTPPPIPTMLTNLMQFSIQSISDVTGISRELMGIVEHEQAGILEYQRKQAGYALLAPFFDALRRYHKEQGHVLLYFLRYIGDGRLIRILGEDQAKYVPFMFDPDVAEYDVIIDEAPAGPNQKETTWRMIVDMLPLLQRADLPMSVWMEIFKYSPIPSSLLGKISKIMEERKGQDQQQQMQQTAQMLALQKLGAEIEEIKSQAGLNMAKAAETGYSTNGGGQQGDPMAAFMQVQQVQQGQSDVAQSEMAAQRMQAEQPPPGHHEALHEYKQRQEAAKTAKAENDTKLSVMQGMEKLRAAAQARKAKRKDKD